LGCSGLLGYRFSPRLADIGCTRFWRIDPQADSGELNALARQRVNLGLIAAHRDDLLRLAGLAQALAEFGRIDKTLHTLTYLDDENQRRCRLTQLNRGEGRHRLARAVFHGNRGELRQRYREGQEDQLRALGLVLNFMVLWNTIYMEAALERLRQNAHL
jgi:TnpA family transposase